jgi:hypothetical protein
MEHPQKGKPKVSIIACVVETKGINSIFRTLDSFLPQEGDIDFEFLVVDETPCYREEIYRERFPWIKLIPVERLMPEPYLRNIALKQVQGEIIVFSEDHVIFTRNYLKNLVHAFSKGYKIVGGPVIIADPELFIGWIQYFLEYNKWILRLHDGVVDDLPGCNYAYHITAVKKLEPFTEDDVKLDSFLNKKAKEYGMELYYCHAVKVAHVHETNIITIAVERFKFGWIFAARRDFRVWKRIAYSILSPAIAVFEYCRIFRNVMYDRTCLMKFFQCTPLLLPILLLWMTGECVGYTVGYKNKRRSGLV